MEDYVMDQPLFINTTLEFEKLSASEARLSDSADTWPQELYQELNKQHPYMGQYDITPEMTEVDGDRGYGYGYFTVTNKTARRALGPGGESMQAIEGVRSIRIPVIIKETSCKPMDVFLSQDGKAQPLTETRVRAELYRPQLFDTPKDQPAGVSIADELYPPSSGSRVLGGGQIVDMPKMSSAKPEFLLEAIAPTILRGDLERVKDTIQKEAALLPALIGNQAAFPFIDFLSEIEPTTAEDIAKVASRSITPDVIQLVRDGERYILKMANSQMFAPEETEADRFTMANSVGEDLVTKADQAGSAVVSTNPVVRETVEDEEVRIVDRFGYYRVKTLEGKEMVGWVFPTVLDYDGTSLPMMVFTNGAVSSIQPEVAGSFAGQHTNIIRGRPEGHGFFYRVTSNGSVVAFIPSMCRNRFKDQKGTGFMVEALGGDVLTLRPTPGFTGIQQLGESEFAIPGDVRWAPMGEGAVKLMDKAEDFAKTAAIRDRKSTVRIISDGVTWSFDGGAGLKKLSSDQKSSLDGADAHFLACSLGMEPNYAVAQLVKAAKKGPVLVRGCRTIHTSVEKLAEFRSSAAQIIKSMPVKYIMVKEAAILPDASSVDKVLSIGFINPENIQTFVEYIPEFEDTVCRLAELLVSTRLGMPDIPESAVKNSMERLDEVLEGLKKLMFRRDVPVA
jgi:hypothetical protein